MGDFSDRENERDFEMAYIEAREKRQKENLKKQKLAEEHSKKMMEKSKPKK